MEIALKYQSTFFMFKPSDKQIISSLNRDHTGWDSHEAQECYRGQNHGIYSIRRILDTTAVKT